MDPIPPVRIRACAPANATARPGRRRLMQWLLPALCLPLAPLHAADFTVSSPGGFYLVNGQQPNPTLTLVRGETYTFAVTTASNHPFRILSSAGTTENNNISSGTITFHVPTNAVNYAYECSIHHFTGKILTIAPPVPLIVGLEVGDRLVLRSTATADFKVLPEFTTNLRTSPWFALTVETNRLVNGTNETICGRPDGTNVFIRMSTSRN